MSIISAPDSSTLTAPAPSVPKSAPSIADTPRPNTIMIASLLQTRVFTTATQRLNQPRVYSQARPMIAIGASTMVM